MARERFSLQFWRVPALRPITDSACSSRIRSMGWGVRGRRPAGAFLPGFSPERVPSSSPRLARPVRIAVKSESAASGCSENCTQLAELALEEHRRSRQGHLIGHSMGADRALGAAGCASGPHVIALARALESREPCLPSAMTSSTAGGPDRPPPAALARDRRAKNVKVPGSHIGLAFNPAVYRVLARTLGAPDLESV